jgi:small-conductance mechanosensitive channel
MNEHVTSILLILVPFLVKVCIALVILILTQILISTLSPIVHEICQRNHIDSHTCYIVNKAQKYVLTTMGIMIALQNVGIDMSSFLAFFGITGVVLSYGMKDIVANFIASILILGHKHIKINDYIKIHDIEGKVISINLRHTTLEYQNMIIFVPNLIIYTQPVTIVNQN